MDKALLIDSIVPGATRVLVAIIAPSSELIKVQALARRVVGHGIGPGSGGTRAIDRTDACWVPGT